MSDNERLVLDARVVDVLSTRAFVAELENGHRFTAFLGAGAGERGAVPGVGSVVRVVFSPFDMTKARIAVPDEAEMDDESAQFGSKDL